MQTHSLPLSSRGEGRTPTWEGKTCSSSMSLAGRTAFLLYSGATLVPSIPENKSFLLLHLQSHFLCLVPTCFCLSWTTFSSVQLLSCVRLFVTPWIAACQASLFITNSWSLLKLMSIELVMPCSHLILCGPLLLLPPIPPSIRVFSNESTLCMRCPKYWSFSFSISPSNEYSGLISFHIT